MKEPHTHCNEIEQMLEANRRFVDNKEYTAYGDSKFPRLKTAIVTCMDTRLTHLLPAALGLRNGDVKMIKNAGGMVTDPLDSSMRSLLVAIYELGVEHVMIIGHTTCGVQGMEGEEMLELMERRGVKREHIDAIERCGVDLHQWLTGFEETDEAVRKSVELVAGHPLMPEGVDVTGWVIDTVTGELRRV